MIKPIDRSSLFDGVAMKPGDMVTIGGCYVMAANPDRRWWQFWRPRMVPTDELQQFRVVEGPTTA
jgi:hypothetical protein